MREKSVNPCQGGGDVSPHGHRRPHGGEGHTGAGDTRHPPGPHPRRGRGLPLSAGRGVHAPTEGPSRRPPAAPGSQPSGRGVLEPRRSRRETRSGWQPGDGANRHAFPGTGTLPPPSRLQRDPVVAPAPKASPGPDRSSWLPGAAGDAPAGLCTAVVLPQRGDTGRAEQEARAMPELLLGNPPVPPARSPSPGPGTRGAPNHTGKGRAEHPPRRYPEIWAARAAGTPGHPPPRGCGAENVPPLPGPCVSASMRVRVPVGSCLHFMHF